MTRAQRIIKYCAIGLAVLLIVAIAVGVIRLVAFLDGAEETGATGEMAELFSSTDVKSLDSLDVDIAAVSLEIKQGDVLSVSSNSKYIDCKYESGKLTLEEKEHSSWFGIHDTDTGELIITLPGELSIKEAEIKTGAGVIEINDLCSRAVDFEFGAGAVTLSGIKTERAEIDGGAGKLTVEDSVLGALDMNMGVGELSLKAALAGNSSIDCGVGKVDLTLVGDPDDYRLKITRGLGSVDVEGLTSDGDNYGSGQNFVEINGGVGSITVKFEK